MRPSFPCVYQTIHRARYGHLGRTVFGLVAFWTAFLASASALFASTNEAGLYVIPAGQEPAISALFDLSTLPGVRQDALSIQVNPDALTARITRDEGPPVSVVLTHPSRCQSPALPNFCVSITSESDGENPEFTAALTALLATNDRVSFWREVRPPSEVPPGAPAHADPAKPAPPPALVYAKTALASFVFAAFFIVLVLPLWWYRRPIMALRWKQSLPVLFWFALALLVRWALIDPVQINHNTIPLHRDWFANFPARGLTVPFIQHVAVWLFGWRDTSIFSVVRVIGSLVPPLAFVLLNRLGTSRAVAHTGAFLFAVTPLYVRLAASDSEHIIGLVAFFGALIAWLHASKTHDLRAGLLTSALLVLVVQSRPEALTLPIVTLLFTRDWRRLPRAMWLFTLPVVLVVMLSVRVTLHQGGFGGLAESAGVAPNLKLWGCVYGSLFQPLAMGLWANDAQWAVYWRDALLGWLPELSRGEMSFRPFYMTQWVWPLMAPFFWLGLVLALRERRFWPLIGGIVIVLLARWFSPEAFLPTVYEFLASRYFLAASAFQIMLAAYGLVETSRFLLARRRGTWLLGGMLVLLAVNMALVFPRPYTTRTACHDEYEFIRDMLPRIPPQATLYIHGPHANGMARSEISLHLFSSLVLLDRKDITLREIGEIAQTWRAEDNSFYIELAVCHLAEEWMHERGDYIPPPATTPYSPDGKLADDRIPPPLPPEEVLATRQYTSVCHDLRQYSGFSLVDRRALRVRDFSGRIAVFPGQGWVSLYRMNPGLDPGDITGILSRPRPNAEH